MKIYNIGRDYEIPFPIDGKHASVSHNHASITVDGDNWTLCDNDSTNGTYVEEDGEFHRCKRLKVTPSTWIRLGEQGHRGYYFKARRVIHPNDYREDFEELYEIFQEYEEARGQLETYRRIVKFITPALMCIGLGVSLLPSIQKDETGIAVRASFMLPGFISPFIQDFFINKLEKKVKRLQKELICPKCRRTLGKDDIINREHSFCHAH